MKYVNKIVSIFRERDVKHPYEKNSYIIYGRVLEERISENLFILKVLCFKSSNIYFELDINASFPPVFEDDDETFFVHNGIKRYILNDLYHRVTGPAVCGHGLNEYYIEGVLYKNKEAFIDNIPVKYLDLFTLHASEV